MLRPKVGRAVCLGVKPHVASKTRFLLLSDSCGFVDVGCHFWREGGFTIAAGPRQLIHYRVRVLRDSLPYFTVSDSRLPQPGGPVPRIYIPQEKDGGTSTQPTFSLVQTENTATNSSSSVACWFITAETYLPSRCVAMTASFCSTIPAFSRHIPVYWIWGSQSGDYEKHSLLGCNTVWSGTSPPLVEVVARKRLVETVIDWGH
jgi:hypothetical protein